jgi:hypothetical protein
MNKILILLTVCFVIASCEDVNVRETEQYVKQMYIVGASDIVWTFDIPYNSEPQSAYISIATGGTQNIDKDVTVALRHNDDAVDWYNNKYMYDAPVRYRKLDAADFNIPSMNAVIKAGEVYARLPFTVTTEKLHCDSLYSITFEIESVSKYEKNMEDSVLIMNLNLINLYSGIYQLDAARYILTYNSATGEYDESPSGSLSVSRTLKAVDENSVRFFNEATAEPTLTLTREKYFQEIDDNCVVFARQSNGAFTVEGWKNLSVSNGTVTYSNDTFEFSYDYVSGGNNYRLRGTMVK